MVPDQITREITIDAPVERVWALITEPEHLGTWFGDAGAEVDLRPGGQMTLRWTEHGVQTGRVEAVEPPHRFAFRWRAYHTRDAPELTPDTSTLVEFTLTEAGTGGTRVTVLESGFAGLTGPDAERTASFEGNTRGWAQELGHLAEHAERQLA